MHPRAPRGSRLLLLSFLLFLTQGAVARDLLQLGWLERVRLQPWDIVVKAKLDTGAKTAAIHATDLEYFDKEGKPWVRFKLSLDHRDKKAETLQVERPLERKVKIKLRGTNKTSTRPTVKLEFCMGENRYQALFTLTDRGRFNYPVLLGRRFLAELAVIDPASKYNSTPTCPKTPQ